ncbi:response regulator transcription factor [Bacilliculturomica massiliensis]|uniref:response regulator transcription factor n=1 Tax=Bacilliculturomica massiliensis TaxID=1917867 RepID=UPI00102F9F15|nr:response regulator [Bacilliculturomica massiliensis]
MYNVLIVDDEPMIRQGMPHILNWEEYGFTIAAAAENGQDAVAACGRAEMHLVLTDIRMPQLDGLSAIDQIRALHPQALFVVLSGYSEFDYARRALNLGVHKYLLKPVNVTELAATLESAKACLDARLPHPSACESLLDRYASRTGKKVMREILSYISENIGGAISLEQLGEKFRLSPVYISQLFKKELAINFVDLVTEFRIEKSKELLLSDVTLKTYEVADLAGYDDVRYFSQIFKRHTGMTPSEYRNQGSQ